MRLTAVFEPAKKGGYTCFVEEIPAAISQGETLEEAKANLLDALKLVLKCQREMAENLSPDALRESSPTREAGGAEPPPAPRQRRAGPRVPPPRAMRFVPQRILHGLPNRRPLQKGSVHIRNVALNAASISLQACVEAFHDRGAAFATIFCLVRSESVR